MNWRVTTKESREFDRRCFCRSGYPVELAISKFGVVMLDVEQTYTHTSQPGRFFNRQANLAPAVLWKANQFLTYWNPASDFVALSIMRVLPKLSINATRGMEFSNLLKSMSDIGTGTSWEGPAKLTSLGLPIAIWSVGT